MKDLNKVLFTTEDGIDIKMGDTYYYIGKEWLGSNEESIIDVTITKEWNINTRSELVFGLKENAQKELDKKDVYKYIEQLESESFEGWSEESMVI